MCVRTRLECKVINDLSQLESTHMVLNEVKSPSQKYRQNDSNSSADGPWAGLGTLTFVLNEVATHPRENGCNHQLMAWLCKSQVTVDRGESPFLTNITCLCNDKFVTTAQVTSNSSKACPIAI